MNSQEELVKLVKIKGIGKTMSKSLDSSQLTLCTQLLLDPKAHMATKTTLLVAFLMLNNTPDEQQWINDIKSDFKHKIPTECYFLFIKPLESNHKELISCIYNVIDKKNLSETELDLCCRAILDPSTPDYYKSALLEALRLKEESKEENAYFLKYFYSKTNHHKVNCPLLIDIASAYDGFNRYPNLLLGLAILLGSVGFPSILHGCKEVSPKFAHTIHKLLKLLKKNPLYSNKEVQHKLEDPSVAWAYIDQSISFPDFHDLVDVRTDLVKRPILASIEKFMQPFVADSTYIVTGFTHPAYRKKTIELLSCLPHCSDFLFVRGIEGSALAPIDRRCPTIYSTKKQTQIIEDFSSPIDYAIKKDESCIANKELTINESVEILKEGLSSSTSMTGQWLVYSALLILDKLNLITDPKTMKTKLEQAIDSKKCLSHLNNY